MTPSIPALARSESKARFFERLSLDEQSERDRMLYETMKAEAVEGRKRIINSMKPDHEGDFRGNPTYSDQQIDDAVMRREIVRIFELAQPDTRHVYSLGHDRDSIGGSNWIIRWMLWHVFRYRDARNHNLKCIRSASSGSRDLHQWREFVQPQSQSYVSPLGNAIVRPSNSGNFWDPVRELWS